MPRNRLLLEDSSEFLQEDISLSPSYNEVLDGIVNYLRGAITDQLDLQYIGKMPSINSREDYEHLPAAIFPFVGVAIPAEDLNVFETMGSNYGAMSIQIIYAFRSSGSSDTVIEEDMTRYLDMLQDLKDILISAMRGTRFDMPEYILSMKVMKMLGFGSFYTEIEKNRKCFHIGFFPLSLEMSGI